MEAPHHDGLNADNPAVNSESQIQPEQLISQPGLKSENVATARPASNSRTLTRRVYFAGFGGVYLIAILSLWSQINDLVGPNGLIPAKRFFALMHERYGNEAYWMAPSICWFDASDFTLNLLCATGCLLCVILFAGLAPRITLVLLWMIYLSLSIAGQTFLSFQWDTLLLEMTLCSLFYAPRGFRPDWKREVTTLSIWPLWFLAFKLMFLSGITKLLSGDSSWLDGTALEFHYYTQPLPTWTAWYAHFLPRSFDWISLLFMFLVEVILPFLVFTRRLGRIIFGAAAMLLMLIIEATGNYGFFNLETMVLCIPLLDDAILSAIVPRAWRERIASGAVALPAVPWRTFAQRLLVSIALLASFLTVISEIEMTAQMGRLPAVVIAPIRWSNTLFLSWGRPWILKPIQPFRTINGYGLFRVMTVQRNEFIIETSEDGVTWTAAEFLYKPGRVDRPPPIVAPHMPRLDWQMWFAALNPNGNQYWMRSLIEQILNGDKAAARLMGHREWIKHPPKYVRFSFYEYTFSTAAQKRDQGAWWNRSYLGASDTFSRSAVTPKGE